MKGSLSLLAFCLLLFAAVAEATEYPLQFTPNPGYRGLVVAGYQFQGNEVVGNCSYYTVSSSGTLTFAQTCRWDLSGNLLSITPGAPAVPPPISIKGTEVVYAVDANGDTTGTDSALPEHGFVSTPGAHYTWLLPQNPFVLQQKVYTLSATLKSDGELPLDITAVTPSALHSTVTLKSTTCIGETKVGDTCTITVTYDDTGVTSPIGLVLDTLRIDLTSNAAGAHDFIEFFVLVLPKS
jgi:hypothetical protein